MKCPHCGGDLDQTDSLFPAPVASPARRAEGNGSDRRSRRTALPKDWLPTPELEKYCRQQGKTVSDCFTAFREYYWAKGTVWKDWGLVWMKWCRTWEPRATPKETALLVTSEPWQARIRGYAKSGFWMANHWGPKPKEPGCRVPASFLEEFTK